MAKKKSKISKSVQLSPKRERFCQEWVIDCNSTQAAIRAKYSKNRAAQTGARLYRDGKIKARIDELQAEISKKLGITAEKVLAELGKLAFTDLADVVEIDKNRIKIKNSDECTKQQLGAISQISETVITTGKATHKTRKVRMHDKVAALNLIGKHLGMFPNKVTGPDGGDLTIKIISDFDQTEPDE